MRRLDLGAPVPPPKGFKPIYRTLAGIIYRWSSPMTCPEWRVKLLPRTAGWLAGNTFWERNDVPGNDIWGDSRRVKIKGVFGPRVVTGGECEDLSLVAARYAHSLGIPLGSMRAVTGLLYDGITGHAFLAVDFEDRTMIWDCRDPSRFKDYDHPDFWSVKFLCASEPGKPYWRVLNDG